LFRPTSSPRRSRLRRPGTPIQSRSIRTSSCNSRRAKAWRRRKAKRMRLSSPSTRRWLAHSSTVSSLRPIRAPVFTTATAGSCSTRDRFRPAAPRADDPWATSGKTMPEVAGALQGKTQSLVRVNDEGETIVSVGVPIQRMMATRGALQLSTQGGDIDRVITSARLAQLRFFLVFAVVMLVLSLSLANTIAEPVRRLADAAERVRRGIRSRQQIPDFTRRSDEIGPLSRALRDMTQALYNRLDAIESFAADVAHELKNPLTSLRSALETLPRVNAGHSRDRLIAVMQHDVRRLDRLISDISDASRLDAELARDEAGPDDVAALLRAVVAMAQDSPRGNGARVELAIPVRRGRNASADYFVLGHDSRLGQVVTNLIDNACSFSEPG